MKTIQGDLIALAKAGQFEVIVHGCNCFHTMGAGVAAQIARAFPDAERVDREQTIKGDPTKLGTISVGHSPNHPELTIVNAYTQFGFSRTEPAADYEAIASCFQEVRRRYGSLSIGYPRIGAGLAGGDWAVISRIIDTELAGCDHTLVEYVP